MPLKMKDLIEVISEFDIQTQEIPQINDEIYYGIIDNVERKIYLSSKITHVEKKRTLVHEIVHGYYFLKGINRTERQVLKEAKELYKVIENET